jgi:hypothetical protein
MRNCFDVTYAKKILHLLQMMQTTRIQDPSFQTQHSGKCDLLIELLPQACRYAVLDIGQDHLKLVAEAANFASFAIEDVLTVMEQEIVIQCPPLNWITVNGISRIL